MNQLLESALPRKLSAALLWPLPLVLQTISTAPHAYKTYMIPKRNGGRRLIAEPTARLKTIQRWVVDNVLSSLPVHNCATGYVKERSILLNAKRHAGASYLLKLDFRDFFPSLRESDLGVCLTRGELPCSSADLEVLSRILFWARSGSTGLRLSIGAPSSPSLSNALLANFDDDVHEFCSATSVTYSRYADDMVFSTCERNVLNAVEEWVRGTVASMTSPRLELNESKTKHASRGHRMLVSGLVLANQGGVGIGREKRRRLHAQVHQFKLGRCTDRDDVSRLAGLLAFVSMVEPGFICRLKRKYGEHVFGQIRLQGAAAARRMKEERAKARRPTTH